MQVRRGVVWVGIQGAQEKTLGAGEIAQQKEHLPHAVQRVRVSRVEQHRPAGSRQANSTHLILITCAETRQQAVVRRVIGRQLDGLLISPQDSLQITA